MAEAAKELSLEQAHRKFAVSFFNAIWPLLEKEGDRTAAEDEEMLRLAYASHHHWLQIGQPVNDQRGEWMLARVHTVLGNKIAALKHATSCFALTNSLGLKDFDKAYSLEAMARAHAVNEMEADARKYYKQALLAADEIAGEKDKEQFISDLSAGPWFGIKQ